LTSDPISYLLWSLISTNWGQTPITNKKAISARRGSIVGSRR
jgi:hypothetical protein